MFYPSSIISPLPLYMYVSYVFYIYDTYICLFCVCINFALMGLSLNLFILFGIHYSSLICTLSSNFEKFDQYLHIFLPSFSFWYSHLMLPQRSLSLLFVFFKLFCFCSSNWIRFIHLSLVHWFFLCHFEASFFLNFGYSFQLQNVRVFFFN